MRQEKFWHSQSTDAVAVELNANIVAGLSSDEVVNRQQKFGLNKLTEHKGAGPLKRFLLQFHQPLVYILLAAVFVTMALPSWLYCSSCSPTYRL